MKISVITWDASFRESFHTVDSFGNQDYPINQFEFIWVDYYKNDNPKLINKIAQYKNTRILNLNRPANEKWHLGRCINEGVKQAKGDILILPDGDIIVPSNFLKIVEQELLSCPTQVTYFRRWDEPSTFAHPEKSYQIDYLRTYCQLFNPTNYAGTIALTKETLNSVNGYEENEVFCGAGISGMELYIRLRNAHLPIKWHKEKIFHPFHFSTGTSDKEDKKLKILKVKYPWFLPYAGLEQSWVVHCRNKNLSTQASIKEVNEYLQVIPEIKENNKGFLAFFKKKG